MRACLVKSVIALSWLAFLADGFASVLGISKPRNIIGSSVAPTVLSRGKQLPSSNFHKSAVEKEISLSSTGIRVIRHTDDDVDEHVFFHFAKGCFETTKEVLKAFIGTAQEFIESPVGRKAIENVRIVTDVSAKKVSEKARIVTQDFLENGFPDDVKEKAKEVIDSPVSLPVGVMLGLALLPFFETLPQTLLTFVIFVYLIKIGRKIHAENFPDDDISSTDFSLLDKCSLGISATAGYTFTPAASTTAHAHHAIVTTSTTTGMMFPSVTIALLGLVGCTCAFLFQKISVPLDEATKDPVERFTTDHHATPHRPKPLKLTWEPKISPEASVPTPNTFYNTETPFNTWDKELRSREAEEAAFLQRNRMKAMSIVRPSPIEYHHLVYRDCYAPPGPLGISIRPTAKGPAVHAVKVESPLYDHVHPGDLIIGYNNIDTRSCQTAEVMKMLSDGRNQQRKITVISSQRELASKAITLY